MKPGANAGDGATPRPWKLDNDAPGQDAQLSSVWGADGTLVIAGEGDGWMVPFACSENGKANARLVIEAVNAHSPLLLRVKELEGALTEAREIVKQYYDESGPCDHAVNICVCRIARVGERIDAALALASKAVAK